MTSRPVTDFHALIGGMSPRLHDGCWVYATGAPTDPRYADAVFAAVREDEGWTIILPEDKAQACGLPIHFRAARITLQVHSALDAAGLTAEVARTLADMSIACNVVAGTYHDHLFVPVELGDFAVEQLRSLAALYKHQA
jgi:uncharacterized protein